MNNKTIIFTFVILLFVFLSTVLIYKNFNSNKETFYAPNNFYGYSNPGDANESKSEWNNIENFIRIPHPSQSSKKLKLFKFTLSPNNSSVTFTRPPEHDKSTNSPDKLNDISYLNKELTFGCFFTNEKPDIIGSLGAFDYEDEDKIGTIDTYKSSGTGQHVNSDPFIQINGFKIVDGTPTPKTFFEFRIKERNPPDKKKNELEVTYNDEAPPLFQDDSNKNKIVFNNIRGLSFISISLKNNKKTYIPELHVNVNNKNYIHPFTENELNFNFPIDKIIVSNFNGFIGNFRFLNRVYDTNDFCKTFNCDLPCFIPQSKCITILDSKPVSCSDSTSTQKLNDNYVEFNGNVNKCIEHCMKTCNNITKCQKICINCEVDGEKWTDEEKALRCPWLEEIKIQDATIPDAPVIRGFPGDGSILVEWKKPFDGRNKITNYIVLFYESFNKKNGIQVSISGESDTDICEYEIKNLKNRTHYDVIIRAVNGKGIGKPSNIVTISPNGLVIANTNQNIFNELEDELNKEVDKIPLDFTCGLTNYDSVGHTLDYYNEADINIKDTILESGKLDLDTPGERVNVVLTNTDIAELPSYRVNNKVFGTVLEYADKDSKVSTLIDGDLTPSLIHISNLSKI